MIQLRVLGSTDLRGPDGQALLSILSQPKRLTLLAYLAMNATGLFVRRDKVLALFWQDSEPERARASLRTALSYLRKSLGEGVLVTRGDEEIGIAPGSLECDAVLFEAAVAAGDPETASAHYRGTFLDAFHVSGAAALDQWLDAERHRLKQRAVEAAGAIADDRRKRGDLPEALHWAHRGLALDPRSEPGVRRLVSLQAQMGDREAAVIPSAGATTKTSTIRRTPWILPLIPFPGARTRATRPPGISSTAFPARCAPWRSMRDGSR